MRRVRYHSHGGPEVLAVEEAGVPEPGPRAGAHPHRGDRRQLRRRPAPPRDRPGLDLVPPAARHADRRRGGNRREGRPGAPIRPWPGAASRSCSRTPAPTTSWPGPTGSSRCPRSSAPAPRACCRRPGRWRSARCGPGVSALGRPSWSPRGRARSATSPCSWRGSRARARSSPPRAPRPSSRFLKELGADVAVDHSQPGWADQVRSAAPGGVDVVLEAVGGETLHRSLGLLAPSGRAVVFGASAGELTSIPVRSLFGAEDRDRVLAAGLARGRSGRRSWPAWPSSPAGSGRGSCGRSPGRRSRWPR